MFLMLSSHVASCGSVICLLMFSTASVVMKLFFGAKPGKFCLRSTIWIDANHRRECGISVLPAEMHSQASGAKSVEGSIASRLSSRRSKDHVSAHTPRRCRVVGMVGQARCCCKKHDFR